jgi:glycosyl transferase family 25
MALSQRCIDSGKTVGNISVEMFTAITPKDDPEKIMIENNLPIDRFKNGKFSRYLNSLGCFLSHFLLWKKCIDLDENIFILEHDAIFIEKFNDKIEFDRLLSVGKPSFGMFKTPSKIGVNHLTSKKYLPGAHGYIITPECADLLIKKAVLCAGPVDVFLSLENFPWIQELYPWIVEVKDTFSTVQHKNGCIAKHNYNNLYTIKEI